ncbi:hypothetical protein OROGR_002071 [Orobanche gracilis]
MGRSPCCDKMGLKKGPWTPDEDTKLLAHIQLHGHGNWHALPSKAGLRRCGKSCRLRWANYLRPDIKRGRFSLEEDETIIQLHALLGNRWSAIAAHLPKRTDNEIKNYWNTHLKKRLTMMGIDPVTHKPNNQALIGCGSQLGGDTPDVSHMAQWESARLEAEARSRLDPLINPDNNLLNTAAEARPPPPPQRSPCLDVLKAWAWANPAKDVSTPAMFMNSLFSPSGLDYHESITNPAGACTAGLPNSYQQQQDGTKGIMGNSMELHDILNPNIDPADSLGFQSFHESDGFTDVATPSMTSFNGPYYHIYATGSYWGVFEDNELNYSCNKLNVVNQGKSSGNI